MLGKFWIWASGNYFTHLFTKLIMNKFICLNYLIKMPIWLLIWGSWSEFEQFCEDLQDILELTPQTVLFIGGDWNAKVGSQETPGVTGKFGLGVQNEARQRLIEFCQENILIIANTLFSTATQEMILNMAIIRWSILKSEWLYSLQVKIEKLYTVSKNKSRCWLCLRSWIPYCQIQT